ncbi:MAG TPA: DUF2103 domain-containing protein [Desulfosporosinus sp.]|nr:DUF2103 domain-containing protein [Desulfosporosinus sp.]
MKHRRNKVKREHGIIQNALLWLENLGCLSEVTDIIPGVIDVSHSSERRVVYKYVTQTGCKLLLKSNGSIQEAFVVTKNPARVQEWVEKEFPPDPPTTASQPISLPNQQERPRKKLPKVPSEPIIRSENKPSPRRRCSKKYAPGKAAKSISGNHEALNVADRLNLSTLKALTHLKKSLEDSKILNAKILNVKTRAKNV